MTDTHLTQIRFDGFDLDQRILDGLADANFMRCTPIQAETLPLSLAGRDVAGQAQTGTGKTAAFLLVTMQRLLANPVNAPEGVSRPRALILAPTRELAVQIHKDTVLLSGHTGLRSTVVYGGTGYQKQRDDLAAGVDILIGTPGRLIDYYKQRVFDLKGIDVVVLDEADRMFDLGFIKDIRYLFRQMPPPEKRLGLLFSATLSYRVTELAYEHMNHPRLVKIETENVTADRVSQALYMTSNEEKIPLLLGLVRRWTDARIMVFVNTKREADRVWGYLQGNGINTAVLSGDVPQKKRLKLLRDFTEGTLPVLVGTDVAARGLHIPDVTHVVNYDLPEDPEDYVHRIGRTARAGAAGDAIGFVCETYAFCLPDIEQYIGNKIQVSPIDPALLAVVDPSSRLRPDREDREVRRDGRGSRPGSRAKSGRAEGEERARRGGRAPRKAELPSDRAPAPVEDAAPTFDSAPVVSEALPELQAPEQPAAPVKRSPRARRSSREEPAALTSAPTAALFLPPVAVSAEPSADAASPGSVDEGAVTAEQKRRRRRRRKPATGQTESSSEPESVD